MSKKGLIILLIAFITGMVLITAYTAFTKPEINKSVVLQIIKYK